MTDFILIVLYKDMREQRLGQGGLLLPRLPIWTMSSFHSNTREK